VHTLKVKLIRHGVNFRQSSTIIVRLSTLLRFATEIKEMDINPLLACGDDIIAVDARILVEKYKQRSEFKRF
jgi:acetyltransferase